MMAVWEKATLGELAEINYGFTAKASFEIDGPKFLRITDIQDGTVNWDKVPSCKIEDTDYLKHKLEMGDIVFARTGATTGKSFLITKCEKSVAASYLIRVRLLGGKILPAFLYLFFQSQEYWNVVSEGISGSAQGGFNASKLAELVIPLPSVPEQKRIVAILDQVFSDIDQARAKTEQNLKNARELFESYLQQVFSERGVGWTTSTLKSITFKIGSGATPRGGRESYQQEGIPLVRSMNVHDRFFKKTNLAFIDDQQADKLSNVIVEKDDVLLNITGASVARCCVAPDEFIPARVNQHVAIIRADQTILTSKLLNYILTSKFYKDQLLGIGEAGSTRQAITKTQIEEFEISFPSRIKEQNLLISSLNTLEAKTITIQDIYKNKLLALDELKKSILQKAFTGQLTNKKGKGVAA